MATTHAAELSVPDPTPAKGSIETVDVPSDRAALFVAGDGEKAKHAIVHLHDTCGEARLDIEAWSSAARAYGSLVALEGEAPCADGVGGRTWKLDLPALEKRIDAALDALRTVRGLPLDRGEVILVGDGVGASRALALAARAPAKYTRLVLIDMHDAAPAYDLEAVHAIAVLAGDREPQHNPRRSMEAFAQAGLTTRFWTLSGAAHGEYGLSGARTIGEAFAFVTQH